MLRLNFIFILWLSMTPAYLELFPRHQSSVERILGSASSQSAMAGYCKVFGRSCCFWDKKHNPGFWKGMSQEGGWA
ncbi:hypothetical protein MKW92_043788 [Papaver armeniacum]|nr:hypothetical protein MKW92_043788 [Papaver armeniacum]